MATLPGWTSEIAGQYESHAASQFVLHGNVGDLFALPENGGVRLAGLEDYLLETLLTGFDVVLTYDLGNGLRVVRGQKVFAQWPTYGAGQTLPRVPREAVDLLTHYARFLSNVRRVKGETVKAAFILREAALSIPAAPGGSNNDLNAMALLVRAWASETALTEHPLATFLITENLNDLHPLVAGDPRSANIRVPLPGPEELVTVFTALAAKYPVA